MKTVIIVNGKPRAGKDTAIAMMANHLKANGIETDSFSSIDPVRAMLARAGFYLQDKTLDDRALLAEVGDAVEKHSRWRSSQSFAKVESFFERTEDRPAVMFLHVREKLLIDRIADKVRANGWQILLVYVKSKRAEQVYSNAADMGVTEIGYDAEISNDGDLNDLSQACEKLLWEFSIIEQLSLLRT